MGNRERGWRERGEMEQLYFKPINRCSIWLPKISMYWVIARLWERSMLIMQPFTWEDRKNMLLWWDTAESSNVLEIFHVLHWGCHRDAPAFSTIQPGHILQTLVYAYNNSLPSLGCLLRHSKSARIMRWKYHPWISTLNINPEYESSLQIPHLEVLGCSLKHWNILIQLMSCVGKDCSRSAPEWGIVNAWFKPEASTQAWSLPACLLWWKHWLRWCQAIWWGVQGRANATWLGCNCHMAQLLRIASPGK